MRTPGTESGCYYNYKDINNINLSTNQINIDMNYKKELKDKKRVLFFQNCEEYARPIIVSRNISITADNFEQLEKVYVDYTNYNETVQLNN